MATIPASRVLLSDVWKVLLTESMVAVNPSKSQNAGVLDLMFGPTLLAFFVLSSTRLCSGSLDS